MKIENLADHPEALPILAEWQHKEWGHVRPGDTVEKRMARLERFSQRDRIPMTVVALEGGEVRGSASLIEHDMETRMELTPWLAGVYVGEEFRRLGIGARLVRGIMSDAAKLNVPLLYLYTLHSEQWYASLGWTLLERTTYRGYDCVIMTFEPTNHQR
jgi:N-acetylglutamate synthase-like GNAT family acetyltransferase